MTSITPLVAERVITDKGGNKVAIAPAYLPSTDFAYTGATLVEPRHGKRYLVAQDSMDKYLATSYFGGMGIARGSTGVVEAYFAAPPSDVSTVNVTLNKVGAFVDVPVS